jgi:putative spermidine/putrescine transport system ATP-binding protein
VNGAVAQSITGSPATFSIRPEKIHLVEPNTLVPDDSYSVQGRVRGVVYLGMYTRFVVELNGGGELTVIEQNLHTTSMDVLASQGRAVRLIWKRQHVSLIPDQAA